MHLLSDTNPCIGWILQCQLPQTHGKQRIYRYSKRVKAWERRSWKMRNYPVKPSSWQVPALHCPQSKDSPCAKPTAMRYRAHQILSVFAHPVSHPRIRQQNLWCSDNTTADWYLPATLVFSNFINRGYSFRTLLQIIIIHSRYNIKFRTGIIQTHLLVLVHKQIVILRYSFIRCKALLR